MKSENLVISQKRKSFAEHSLKTEHVNRINPPSVFLKTPSCIHFIFSNTNNNIKHTALDAGLYAFFSSMLLYLFALC